MDFADIFDVGRAGLLVNLKSSVAASDDGFCDRNPWIIVTEDTCVFLVTAGICGDFAVLDVVVCECRVVKNKTVF